MNGLAGRICLLASLKFTLVNLLLLFVGVVITLWAWLPPTWALALPVTLLAVNLAAAIACNRKFRSNAPLLLFHLALLAILLLVALGRMTYLQGWVQVAEETDFTGELLGYRAGPWHPWRLDRVEFTSERFELDYRPGPRRDRAILVQTRNWVTWFDEGGRKLVKEVGDNVPLVLQGYRFYTTTSNKGFAPTFTWYPRAANAVSGSVALMLPRYPEFEFQQAVEWQPSGLGEPLWVMLEFDETILASDRPSRFRLPGEHRIVIRRGAVRHELRPGDRLEFDEGQLIYRGLRRWLGYDVHWDMTLWWLLAVCALAVASLGWYFAAKFRARPWQQPD